MSVQHVTGCLVFVNTHPQFFKRAVSQCIRRNEYRELPRRTAVAERVCEYGGACSRVSHASGVYLDLLFTVPGRYASLITSCAGGQYGQFLLTEHAVYIPCNTRPHRLPFWRVSRSRVVGKSKSGIAKCRRPARLVIGT
jgi:hypothetical protein